MTRRRLYRNNKSGHPGVTWCPSRTGWVATLGVGGKLVWLGSFKEKDLAIAARKAAELAAEAGVVEA